MTPADRPAGAVVGRPLLLVPMLLAVVAEAAWCAAVAGLLQAFFLRDPGAGIPLMLTAALAGVLAARTLAVASGNRWPALAVGLAVAVGATGWLSSAEARSTLLGPGGLRLPGALVAAPGGWIAGVAFLRGIAHATPAPDPRTIGTALGVGIPGLAVTALLGGMVAEPWRGEFLAAAHLQVVVFLVAGILALALGRLTLVGSGAAVDWRRNPAWLWLLLALVLVVAAAAVAASLAAGPLIVTALATAVPPLMLLGLVAGFDRRSIRILVVSVALAVLIAELLQVIDAVPSGNQEGLGSGILAPGTELVATPVAVGIVVLLVAAAIVAAFLLVRRWMRRPRPATDDAFELRWIDHGEVVERGGGRRRTGGRFGRPGPTDAVSAYRALLAALDRHPLVRREAGETPAEHAARLRRQGTGSLSLDLLAADYGLARFGGFALSVVEDRRAVRRASLLRRRLSAVRVASAARSDTRGGPGAEERPGESGTGGEVPAPGSQFRVG